MGTSSDALFTTTVPSRKPPWTALVAAHAWDCHGAKQAGLLAGWVERQDKRFQPAFQPPDVTGNTVLQVCERLFALPAK